LSTLTKVLIVLLTVASIFLCGIVVTYVASANNYKEMWANQRDSAQAAMRQRDQAKEDLNALKAKMDEERTRLNADITSLQAQITDLQGRLRQAITDREEARRRKENYEAILADYSKTVQRNDELRMAALDAEEELKAERTRLNKRLEDVTTALNEKLAIVDELETKVKGLIEEKTALQEKLDKFLRQYGKVTGQAEPVTTMRETVSVAPPVKDIDLEGLLASVDLKNNIAELSIGAADGVEEGMRFHVVRDSKFICDVVVLDVEPEKSLGWLELLQDEPQNKPKSGDVVRTNL
jgi:predicted RNase H-like nuclease (RuvC/YqgF family)